MSFQILKSWLEIQPAWQREAAKRLLAQGSFTDTDIAVFVARIKAGVDVVLDDQDLNYSAAANSNELRLKSIGPVDNIDKLNPREPLSFGSGNLAVVYGHNGSGKSGYTRILKKCCGKAGAQDLKPNVFGKQPIPGHCELVYTLDGTDQGPITWQANADSIQDLQAIDIFDTAAGRIYLDQANSPAYEPPELTFFTELVAVCKRVDEIFATEESVLVSALPDFPIELSSTAAMKSYQRLSSNLTENQIDQLFSLSADEKAQLKSIPEQLNVSSPAEQAKILRQQLEQINTLRTNLTTAVTALSKETRIVTQSQYTVVKEAERVAQEAATGLSDVTKLDGFDSETWQAMWKAAQEYSQTHAYPDSPFPQTEEAHCVLCQQELQPEAAERLKSFNQHVEGSLRSAANTANITLQATLERLPKSEAEASLITTCQAALIADEMQQEIITAWRHIDETSTALLKNPIDDKVLVLDVTEFPIINALQTEAARRETAAEQYEAMGNTVDKISLESKLAELKGKEWTDQQIAAIKSELARKKQVDKIKEWRKQARTSALTSKSGEISQQTVTDQYILRFNGELKLLGSAHISVEIKKSSNRAGLPYHQVVLVGATVAGTTPGQILSEGEHRVIALAAFLADVMARDANVPFVFDDPISSLDLDYEECVVKRLAALSENRQVIVFTHRLSFLGLIGDVSSSLETVYITREPWGTGQPGVLPIFAKKPDKALKALKNDRIARARKSLNDQGTAEYAPIAKSICSDFRILLERIVEIELLADVIQRHRRAINTMGKLDKLARITSDDCSLIDGFMTKYSVYEHSQSEELPAQPLGPDEIEKDIETVLEWLAEFKKRTP